MLICSKLFLSLLMTFKLDIDLSQQLAIRNATLILLSALPVQLLALGLYYLFYKNCHVWRSEGVIVGFSYDLSPENNAIPSLQGFKGSWVSHTIDDSPSTQSETSSQTIPLTIVHAPSPTTQPPSTSPTASYLEGNSGADFQHATCSFRYIPVYQTGNLV